MDFKRYQHLERYGNEEVEGIEFGDCYIFSKLDGTNSSAWKGDDGEVQGGSRNRTLTLENDNGSYAGHDGFLATIRKDDRIKAYLHKHPTHRLYGEFLVPHSLRTYRDDAWRKFYIFDVSVDKGGDEEEYIPYDTYKDMLDEFELDYLAPLAIIRNGSYEMFMKMLEKNIFLIKDGQGTGEGIVLKNYNFYNKFHRQTWAKIVTAEFKEKNHKLMGAPLLSQTDLVELKIVDEFVTEAFVNKEYAKIVNDNGGWQAKYIPMLLSRVFYELITEETWNILKKHKNPKIDFKLLNVLTVQKIKRIKTEIFG